MGGVRAAAGPEQADHAAGQVIFDVAKAQDILPEQPGLSDIAAADDETGCSGYRSPARVKCLTMATVASELPPDPVHPEAEGQGLLRQAQLARDGGRDVAVKGPASRG